jgi:hypothetical protein
VSGKRTPTPISWRAAESFKEYDDETKDAVKRRAMEKLSFEEKKALGLI